MSNNASWVSVVGVQRVPGSSPARGWTKVILLHWCRDPDDWFLRTRRTPTEGAVYPMVYVGVQRVPGLSPGRGEGMDQFYTVTREYRVGW